MIVKIKKILLYGIKQDLDTFLQRAQQAGFLEFITTGHIKKIAYPNPIQEMITAIKALKKLPATKEAKKTIKDAAIIAKRICHITSTLDKLQEQKQMLVDEMQKIQPFGSFSFDDIAYIEKQGKRFIQFFTLQTTRRKDISFPEDLIYITTEYDQDYFISFTKKKKAFPKFIEIEMKTSLSTLQDKIYLIDKEIQAFEEEIKQYQSYLPVLKQDLLEKLNVFYKEEASKKIDEPLANSFITLQAWIPITKEKKLEQMLSDLSLDYEMVAIEEKEKIPTYFENKPYAKVGEDLVKIYDLPSYKDKDPSLWVLTFFSLFYAIIISDAGYGLLYLLLSWILHWMIKSKKPLVIRFKKLCFLLSYCCIFWGVLTGSFFGNSISPDSKLNRYVLLNHIAQKKASYHLQQKDEVFLFWKNKYPQVEKAKSGKDFIILCQTKKNGKIIYDALDKFKNAIFLEIALFIGVLHLCLSFLRNLRRNLAGIGWVIFMMSGYLYFPKILHATSFIHFYGLIDKAMAYQLGLIGIEAGIALVVILSFIRRKFKAFLEVAGIIQLFADALSYLRLYALGLSSMILASTMNMLAGKVPWFLGIGILLIGHTVAFALGIMGGVIHGLRLNFIEWYHYSFEGDGKLLNPLKLFK